MSDEFRVFQSSQRNRMAGATPMTLQETRARMDAVMSGLPLADRVTAEELDLDGVAAIVCRREGIADDPYMLYFHGGGYRLGSAVAYRAYGSYLALVCRARVVLVDYRLAPEHPFPGAVDDVVRSYRWLMNSLREGEQIVVGGDSAGGGLVGALLLSAKTQGMALPVGAFMLSPWADLTNRSDSYVVKAETDKLFSKLSADDAARLYLGSNDPMNPLASPLYGDWSGLPPILIQASDAEVLVDDARGVATAIQRTSGEVDLQINSGMPHVWQINYPAYPEAVQAVERIAVFVRQVTSTT